MNRLFSMRTGKIMKNIGLKTAWEENRWYKIYRTRLVDKVVDFNLKAKNNKTFYLNFSK